MLELHAPVKYSAPPEFLVGMQKDLYSMKGGVDRVSFNHS